MPCSIGLLFWSLGALPLGLLAFVVGVRMRRGPQSALPTVWPLALTGRTKILGPVIGASITAVGAFGIISQTQCRSYVEVAHLADLHWTSWPGSWLAILISAIVGISNARKKPFVVGAAQALLVVFFGVSVGQAAGFHTGTYADRWFAIGMICLLLAGALEVAVLNGDSARKDNESGMLGK